MKRVAALAALAVSGCAASPYTMPGFVEPQTDRGTAGGDVRATGLSGSGVAAGPVLRVTPRIDERTSIPLELGAHVGTHRDALSYATFRAGVRLHLDSGIVVGGGLVGHGVRRSGGFGGGGGADFEIGLTRSWNRWALSFVARPGFSATSASFPTAWIPGELAIAYRIRPTLSLYGAVNAAGGVAFAGPFGMLVSGGGASFGLSGRFGRR